LTLLSSLARADDKDIPRAIQQGVTFLKSQQADGSWKYQDTHAGATALAGLTLLECDVPADDPAVQKAAQALRPKTIELTHTYSLALASLFLDGLGEPDDGPLIQSMAVRLLAGQNSSGGWSYDCPPVNKDEARRLTILLQKRRSPPPSPPSPVPEPR